MSSLILRSLARTQKTNAAIRAFALRYSSNKPAIPVNEPPNDHLTFPVATIDDLPVPQGDYYEDFKKQNRRYWRHFFIGVSWLSFSLYWLIFGDLICWNAYPPPLPPKEERLKSFWIRPTYWDDEDDDEDE